MRSVRQRASSSAANRSWSRDCATAWVTEPRPERRGVGNGRLAEIEEGADFGPLSFECAVANVERDRLRRKRYVERARQPCHRLRIEDVRTTREAATVAEEQQHDGEAEPVHAALCGDQRVVGRCQVPAALSGAGWLVRQGVHRQIVAVGSIAGQVEEDLACRPLTAPGGKECIDRPYSEYWRDRANLARSADRHRPPASGWRWSA
jgi:hypothetical protein